MDRPSCHLKLEEWMMFRVLSIDGRIAQKEELKNPKRIYPSRSLEFFRLPCGLLDIYLPLRATDQWSGADVALKQSDGIIASATAITAPVTLFTGSLDAI